MAPIGAEPKTAESAERAVSRWAAGTASKRSLLMTVPYTTPRTGAISRHSCSHVLQHETGPTGAPDAVAKIIRGGAGVGADPHLIEWTGAAVAQHRTQQARILIADHGAKPFHG